MNQKDTIDIILCWQVLATSIAIYSIILCIKRIAIIYNIKMKDNKDFKIILTFLNTFIGIIFAFIPDFLPGSNFKERAVIGIVCGFLSNYSYVFIKKFINNKEIYNDKDKDKEIQT